MQAFRYGKSGSTQRGIDVIRIDAAAKKCDCYEGKRVEAVSRGNINDWVDRFLAGPHASDARSFYLCTTYRVSEHTELILEWKEVAKRLSDRGINGQLWDHEQLHQLLRKRRDIVSELFGEEVADGFCFQDEPSIELPQDEPFRDQYCQVYGHIASLQNLGVACEVALPTMRALSTSASFSFSRRELSGITIAVSGKELVRWMQWSAYANAGVQRPYALPFPGKDGKFIYAGSGARLVLTGDELSQLDWILTNAWAEFQRTSKDVLLPLQCSRFTRIQGTEAFGLISVPRGLWQVMLEFAMEFDVSKGRSPWNMFDGAPGCLKPYSETASEHFMAGYHAILYAYHESGIWLPWEERVLIGWTPPTDIGGKPQSISPRGAWSAEFTHDWLRDEFIPEVLRWHVQRQTPRRKSWASWPTGDVPAPIDASELATSHAAGIASLSVVANDLAELYDCVTELQSHANARRSEVSVPAAVIRAVLKAVQRVLPFAELSTEIYLRGSLEIAPEFPLEQAVLQRIEACCKAVNYPVLDYALRGLLEVLDKARNVPRSELSHIGRLLQPVLDRYHEDVLCDLFTSE